MKYKWHKNLLILLYMWSYLIAQVLMECKKFALGFGCSVGMVVTDISRSWLVLNDGSDIFR